MIQLVFNDLAIVNRSKVIFVDISVIQEILLLLLVNHFEFVPDLLEALDS